MALIDYDTDGVNIMDMKLGELAISKPRKTDDSLFGKAVYEKDAPLNIFVSNAQVVKHKRVKHMDKYYSIMFLKVPKKTCKAFIDFDAYCVEHVKQNMGGWFTKSLDENIIEEYYTASVSLSKKDGFIIKLKIQNAEDLLENARYDMLLQLKGLRFYKTRFIPEWDIQNVKRVEDDFINTYNSDDEDAWDQGSDIVEDDVTPTQEEIAGIRNELHGRLLEITNEIECKMMPLKERMEVVSGLMAELETAGNSLKVLDQISEEVEKLA